MYALLIVVHVLICIGLVIVVLLQSAKGEGLAGAFGGGGGLTGAVFGGRGAATFLSKATAYLAIAFMLSCVGLALVTPGGGGSGQDSAILKEMQSTPKGLDELPLRPEAAEQSEAVFPPPADTTK
ncbi:MAG: preprotein translocase subunit SecG [Candidatus Zixiibacteriota bacterium]